MNGQATRPIPSRPSWIQPDTPLMMPLVPALVVLTIARPSLLRTPDSAHASGVLTTGRPRALTGRVS